MKILFSFILFTLFFTISFANENEPLVTSITYEGYLGDNTEIIIKGKELLLCSNITVNGNLLNTKSRSNEEITYLFNQNDFLSGYMTFDCGAKILSEKFSFPYIKNFKTGYKNNIPTFELLGNNFSKTNLVKTESGSIFTKKNTSESSINGNLPFYFKGDNVFVSFNNLKSNLIIYDFKKPYIDYITSKKGFSGGEKITIHGKNLNVFLQTHIVLGDFVIKDFSYDKNNNITFILPNIVGGLPLSVVGNGLHSNSVILEIMGEYPVINSVYVKGENIILYEGGEKEYLERLYIIGEGFPKNSEIKYVVINGLKYNVTYNTSKKIVLDYYKLDPLNNFIYLDLGLIKSNIYNYFNKTDLPYISYVENDGIEGNNRIVDVGIGYYDKNYHNLFYNNSRVNTFACITKRCKVKINKSELRGFFSVGMLNTYMSEPKYFDVSFGKTPIISSVVFKGDLKRGTKFKIIGENLGDSVIQLTNLSKKTDTRYGYPLTVNNSAIDGRLMLNYKSGSVSTISITKNGIKTSLSFKGSELIGNKVIGIGTISEIKPISNGSVLKAGNTVKLIGRSLSNNIFVIIGKNKIPLKINSVVEGTFQIPLDTVEGKHKIFIENKNGIRSLGYDILVGGKDIKDKMIVEEIIKDKNKLYSNTEYSKEFLYGFSVYNLINDIKIPEFKIKLEGVKNYKNLGLFKLEQNGIIIGEGLISKKGIITFKDIYINKSSKKHIFTIYKSSSFKNIGSYKLSILDTDSYIKGTNKKDIYLDLTGLRETNITVFIKPTSLCLDSLSSNTNCDLLNFGKKSDNNLDKKDSKLNNKTTDNENKDKDKDKDKVNIKENIKDNKEEKKVNNKQDIKKQIYVKIDKVLLNYINKNTKLDLKSRLNNYKNFKFKIKKIILKNKNSKNLEFIEYFHDKINIEYKKTFKEYVLSRKK